MKNTATITVIDVEIRERTVEVPLQCPHCDAALGSDTAETTIMTVSIDEVDDRGTIDIGPGLDEPDLQPNERYEDVGLGFRDIVCAGCDKSVIEEPGTLRVIREDGIAVNG